MNTTRSHATTSPGNILITLAACVLMLLLATVPLAWRDQAVLGVVLFAAALFLNRASASYRVTLLLVMLSLFSTFRYAWWRGSETYRFIAANGASAYSWDLIFVFLLLAAEAYTVVILTLGYFQGLKPLDRKPYPMPADIDEWPVVDVFIPTYNEPLEVVKPTVLAAMNMDWPADKFRVAILDDGKRPEFREFAEQAGCGYFVRPTNEHAKAGNINNALKQTDGELVVIFDCDHVPTRSFLQMSAGWFLADKQLAMLQTPHHFYSADPFERNLSIFRKVPNEGLLFYGVVQDGNDTWNATFFCGSCAVMRRTALEEIGGVAVETVTEDAHTSLRMQRNGWNTAYINLPQAAGLATAKLADHIGQRIRWARGMVQILRIDTPLFGKGLSLPQRLCYFNSVIHYLYALPRMIFLTAPLLYLLFGMTNMFGYVVAICSYALPHLALATLTNSRIQGRFRHSFWNEVYETVLAPYILLPTMAALINPKWGKFNVTPKSGMLGKAYFDWRIAMPFLVLLVLNLTAIAFGIQKLGADDAKLGTLLINLFWAAANTVTLGAAVAVAYEAQQHRKHARVDAALPARMILANGAELQVTTTNIANGGLAATVNGIAALKAGENVAIEMQLDEEPVNFPAVVIEYKDNRVRAAFHELSLEQESDLASIIYSRANSWLSWRNVEVDRPLRSLARISRIALDGLFTVPSVMFGLSRSSSASALRSAAPMALLLGALFFLFVSRLSAAPSQSFDDRLPFRGMGVSQPLTITGIDGRASIPFSMPVTKIASSAHLSLRYQLPPEAAPGELRLVIVLNGSEVGAAGLRTAPQGARLAEERIEIPADLLMSENTLQFQLAGHCNRCAAADNRSLKATIDLSSSLEVKGDVLPIPNELRLLPMPFFDATSNRASRFQIVFASAPKRETLEAAGVIASWFGAMSDHRGAEFNVSVGSIPQGNVIVLAGPGAALPSADVPTGPSVSIIQNPNDVFSKALIVRGDTDEQILNAAKALVHARNLTGETASLLAPSAAARQSNDAPRWLRDGRVVPVTEFALPEQLRLLQGGALRLYFRLAPDLYYGSRIGVPFHVNFKMAGLARASSALIRWKLNGVVVSETRVNAAETAEVRTEKLLLPVAHLYPRNTFTAEIQYDRASASAAPEFAIQKDSTLDLTGLSHFVRMPRLDLFAKSGFPFTRMADLSQTAVVLPDNASSEQIGLYLGLMGLFGARTGLPATGVSVHNAATAAASGKDLLVLGSGVDQPLFAELSKSLPVRTDGDEFIMNAPRNLAGRIAAMNWLPSGAERAGLGQTLSSEAPIGAVLQSIPSPYSSDRVVVTLATPSANNLESLTSILDRSVYTEDVFGSVSVQQAGRFHSFRIGTPSYHTGVLSWSEAFYYWAGVYSWLIPILVIVFGLFLAARLEIWVDFRRANRLQLQTLWMEADRAKTPEALRK